MIISQYRQKSTDSKSNANPLHLLPVFGRHPPYCQLHEKYAYHHKADHIKRPQFHHLCRRDGEYGKYPGKNCRTRHLPDSYAISPFFHRQENPQQLHCHDHHHVDQQFHITDHMPDVHHQETYHTRANTDDPQDTRIFFPAHEHYHHSDKCGDQYGDQSAEIVQIKEVHHGRHIQAANTQR